MDLSNMNLLSQSRPTLTNLLLCALHIILTLIFQNPPVIPSQEVFGGPNTDPHKVFGRPTVSREENVKFFLTM